jgi:ribosomal protein L37AE/L43A
METFVYSCPSCGAKVEFNENTRLWECSYCENVYEAVFDDEDNKLPKINDINYTIYRYNCDKCNQSFLSVLEKDGLCNSCNNVVKNNGEPINVHNVLVQDVTRGTAAFNYNQNLKDIDINLHNDYNGKDFNLYYYEFDSYQGVIKFSYENKTKKYIFADLFIPNIDYEDYRFLCEVSKTKVRASSSLNNKNVDLIPLTKNPYNSRKLNNIDNKIVDEDTIVEICRNHFMKNNHIRDIEKIKEERSFSHNEGNYIPVYVFEQNRNDVIYREYQFGNSNFNKQDNVITEFDDSTIDKIIFKLRLNNIAMTIGILILFVIFTILSQGRYLAIIILVEIVIFSNYLGRYFRKNKKRIKKLDSSRLITRKEYINNLINNGQIKVIDSRNKR